MPIYKESIGVIQSQHNIAALLTTLSAILCQGCGFVGSNYKTYPPAADASPVVQEICPVELAAFTHFVVPMLRERCSGRCHVTGGSAGSQLAFTGQSETDLETLKRHEGGTALGLYRKGAGLVSHGGGKAALESDRNRLEKWFTAAALCQSR